MVDTSVCMLKSHGKLRAGIKTECIKKVIRYKRVYEDVYLGVRVVTGLV